MLVFSQSILSLDLIEDFLGKVNDAHESAKVKDSALSGYLDTWIPGKDYYRMDGSTPADTRKIWCKFFNRATSHRMRLFLISTKAGGLGINLQTANRVRICKIRIQITKFYFTSSTCDSRYNSIKTIQLPPT